MRTRVYDTRLIFDFVRQYTPLAWVENMTGIGLECDGALVAGVLYEGWNGHNVWMHVGEVQGKRWMNRDYLQACFVYPFVVGGCTHVRAYVEASNTEARKFDEHLGFRQEAVLKGAASDGGDVILYAMHRDECRFLGARHGVKIK